MRFLIGTGGATGSTAVGACLCAAGYENELTTPESACDACALGTWLGEIGPGPCTACTENAVTEGAVSSVSLLLFLGHTR